MIAVEVSKNYENFNCEACQHKNCNEDNPASWDRWEIPGVIKTNICLKPMVTERSAKLIWLYGHYKNSVLAYSGGVLEQPAVYARAMQLIEHLLNETKQSGRKL